MLETTTRDNLYCTCLGHLGLHDTDRIFPIGHGKYSVTVVGCCRRCFFIQTLPMYKSLNQLHLNMKNVLAQGCFKKGCLLIRGGSGLHFTGSGRAQVETVGLGLFRALRN